MKIGKKCQQYGHSCLGGHGKRSSDLAKPTYPSQLASDESEAQFDYDDVSSSIPATIISANSPITTNNGYEHLPVFSTGRYPLWFVQRFQKRQKTLNSDPYSGIPAPQSSPSQQATSTHFNQKYADIDQIYPVRVKGSVGQFSITDQIPFPL